MKQLLSLIGALAGAATATAVFYYRDYADIALGQLEAKTPAADIIGFSLFIVSPLTIIGVLIALFVGLVSTKARPAMFGFAVAAFIAVGIVAAVFEMNPHPLLAAIGLPTTA